MINEKMPTEVKHIESLNINREICPNCKIAFRNNDIESRIEKCPICDQLLDWSNYESRLNKILGTMQIVRNPL